MLLSPEIQKFIRENETADVAALALKKPPQASWPYKDILDQIKSRQKARSKMPSWLEHENIIFPAPNLIEQASSLATARYKASLIKGNNFADLTAGSGLDFLAFLGSFKNGIAIEQNQKAAEILVQNLKILTNKNPKIISGDAENEIENLPALDLIYIDPQRRNENKKGLFRFEDCSPDILKILPQLFQKSKTIMIKASPVLDIDRAINELKFASSVHIVEWRGECREILYVLERNAKTPTINPLIIDDNGNVITKISFTREIESQSQIEFSQPLKFLFEPSPAFQKSGGFKFIAAHYRLKKLHPHTHLYTSDHPCPDFPGRSFTIQSLYPVNAKNLPLTQANLAIRNFPDETENLRKKLKLKDGGDDYLFACTLADEQKALIHGRKPENP